MFDSIELIFWGALLLVLWLRGLARAAQRQRASEALEGARDAPSLGRAQHPVGDPGPVERTGASPARRSSAGAAERWGGTGGRPGRAERPTWGDRPGRSEQRRSADLRRRSSEQKRRGAVARRTEGPGRTGQRGRLARADTGADAAPARRPSFLEKWAELARELERDIGERAEDRRSGGLFPAETEEDTGETILIPGRRVEPPKLPSRAPLAPPPSVGPAAPKRPGGPLARLESYGPLQRAVLLSEILGTPPGWVDHEPGSPGSEPGPRG